MRDLFHPFIFLCAFLAGYFLMGPPKEAQPCEFKFCQERAKVAAPRTTVITNTHRQRVGDIYDPGHGRRLQIRNNSRQIIGYIERDGAVTNTRRQKKESVK